MQDFPKINSYPSSNQNKNLLLKLIKIDEKNKGSSHSF